MEAKPYPATSVNDGYDLLFRSGKHELWWREMAGYAFRLRRRSYGGRLGFNPPCPVAVTPPPPAASARAA